MGGERERYRSSSYEKVQTEVEEINWAKKRGEEDEKRNRSSCRRRHVLHFKVCELWARQRQRQHPAPCTLPDESTKWQKNTEQQEFALVVSVPVASAQCPAPVAAANNKGIQQTMRTYLPLAADHMQVNQFQSKSSHSPLSLFYQTAARPNNANF